MKKDKMKKTLLILIFALVGLISNAQSSYKAMTGNADTVTNVETDYVTLAPSLFYGQMTFQAVVTKISGTVEGYALLQVSNDNVNFHDENTDTLSNTNQTTNTKSWVITNNCQKYYRIKFVSAGTMSAKIYGFAWLGDGKAGKGSVNMVQAYGSTSDTVTNSATGYVGYTLTRYYTKISIQVIITKISGTVGGTVTVQGSLDGTTYTTVDSDITTSSTLTPTNQTTNSKIFTITGSPYKYYRLSYTGTGTMSATIKGYLVTGI